MVVWPEHFELVPDLHDRDEIYLIIDADESERPET